MANTCDGCRNRPVAHRWHLDDGDLSISVQMCARCTQRLRDHSDRHSATGFGDAWGSAPSWLLRMIDRLLRKNRAPQDIREHHSQNG